MHTNLKTLKHIFHGIKKDARIMTRANLIFISKKIFCTPVFFNFFKRRPFFSLAYFLIQDV